MDLFNTHGHLTDDALKNLFGGGSLTELERLEIAEHLDFCDECLMRSMGVYAGKTTSLKDLPDGATIAIPNDATNEGRALLLLEAQGLIKLKDSTNLESTPNDIAENPKNLTFKELEAAMIPNTVEEVDLSVINCNYALQAGFNPVKDALAIEDANSPYVNIVAVKEGHANCIKNANSTDYNSKNRYK